MLAVAVRECLCTSPQRYRTLDSIEHGPDDALRTQVRNRGSTAAAEQLGRDHDNDATCQSCEQLQVGEQANGGVSKSTQSNCLVHSSSSDAILWELQAD